VKHGTKNRMDKATSERGVMEGSRMSEAGRGVLSGIDAVR
jgi:hypothetical protein